VTCERFQQIGIEETPFFGQSQHIGMKKGGFWRNPNILE
jgi:hypothetical protein